MLADFPIPLDTRFRPYDSQFPMTNDEILSRIGHACYDISDDEDGLAGVLIDNFYSDVELEERGPFTVASAKHWGESEQRFVGILVLGYFLPADDCKPVHPNLQPLVEMDAEARRQVLASVLAPMFRIKG